MAKNYRAELVGCFGDPIDGNPTGVVEEAAFRACGLNWRYLPLLVRDGKLPEALEGAKAMHFQGLNLTMPHKISVLPYLDGLTQAAEIIGAVNTVFLRDGRWIGENTDGKGFLAALEKQGISPAGRHITVLGAGGAARAISVECALAGARSLTVVNRSREHGRNLARLLASKTETEARFLPWSAHMAVPEDTDILINGTCVGLHPLGDQKPDLDYGTITEQMMVCDVVFNPVDPLFLQEARKRGAGTVSGLGMLVQQAALNFTLWTGREAPTQLMYDTLKQEFTR